MYYHIDMFYGTRMEDVWNAGCVADDECCDVDVQFDAGTQTHMLEKVMTFFVVDKEGIILDEIGRVDVQRYETEDGMFADNQEITLWKAGKLRLWLANYTGYLRRVEDCEWEPTLVKEYTK